MKEFLFVTSNDKKLKAFQALFTSLGIKISKLQQDHPEDIESASTPIENAIKKAQYYVYFHELPVLTHDGGIKIDGALYAEFKRNYEEILRVTKRGSKLEWIDAFAISSKNGALCAFQVPIISGRFLPPKEYAQGNSSFLGEDIFYIPLFKKVYGQLTENEKEKIEEIRLSRILPKLKQIITNL
ncbi:MAG: hypothetical protein D6769_03220 [Methanobacteriota archaeon]|nr:MAG: hypothetical protein D6769_03220 [Euryarchaeota archaeon]